MSTEKVAANKIVEYSIFRGFDPRSFWACHGNDKANLETNKLKSN